jgi:hypothetical protein
MNKINLLPKLINPKNFDNSVKKHVLRSCLNKVFRVIVFLITFFNIVFCYRKIEIILLNNCYENEKD